MYLRNVDSVGWDFCVMRQHGSVADTCAKMFGVDTLQKSLFSCLVANVSGTGVSLYLLYTEMGAELIILAFLRLLFASLPHPHNLQVISPCLCR
jgi:hypothetical protein